MKATPMNKYQKTDKLAPVVKPPEFSMEAEQSLLGGLMLTRIKFEQISEVVSESDFFRADHRLIFNAIATLSDRGQSHNLIAVWDLLESRGQLEDAGSQRYLGSLGNDTAETIPNHLTAHARIVHRHALKRQRLTAIAQDNEDQIALITNSIRTLESEKTQGAMTTINDILARKSEYDWLIQGWIERHQTIVLFGESQSYKSLLAIDLACCIATGKLWRGKGVKQGAVLYVVGEGAGSGLTRRFRAWEIANQTPLIGTPILIQESATVLPDDADRLIAEAKSILLSKGWTLELVILDTLNRTMAGDERDSGDFSKYQRALDWIKQTFDCSAMYIHHTGHADKKRERGVSEIGCNADVRMQMEIIGEKTRRLHVPKIKDADTPDEFIFTLATVEIEATSTGQPITSVVLRQLIDHTSPIQPALRPQQRAALQLLSNLYHQHSKKLADMGEDPDMATVGEDQWQEAMKSTIKDRGQRSRLRAELIDAGYVAAEDNFVYLTTAGKEETRR